MSLSQSKALDVSNIDHDKAFDLADRKARQMGTELRRTRRSGHWLIGLAFPVVVACLGAGLGAAFGDDLARTSLGRALIFAVQPIMDAFAGAGPVEFIVGAVFVAIVTLVWYVRS